MDTPSFPVSPSTFFSAPDFGLSILAATLSGRVRTSFPICYIPCIMCTCFWTYGTPYILLPIPTPFPSPSPSLFDRLSRPSALLKLFSWPLSVVRNKSIFLCEGFSLGPFVTPGDQMVALFLTLPGSDKTYFHLHLFGPPFRSAHDFVPLRIWLCIRSTFCLPFLPSCTS